MIEIVLQVQIFFLYSWTYQKELFSSFNHSQTFKILPFFVMKYFQDWKSLVIRLILTNVSQEAYEDS